MSAHLDVSKLVAAGCNVGDLRKLNVSPADIRAAGFTIQQMHEHLGIERLSEAGFTLPDFQEAGFSVSELVKKFSLKQLADSGKKYPLNDLLMHFSPSELRTIGRIPAADFVALGTVSAANLREFGYPDAEIWDSGVTVAPVPAPSPHKQTSLQPPNAAMMKVGEKWNTERNGEASTFLKVTYSRVSEEEARKLLTKPHPQSYQNSNYSYDGSGKNCPRCGRLFVLLSKYTSSDGFCGVESGTWVCDDAICGMYKEERYEGYSSIF
jgi:hypothetical protein